MGRACLGTHLRPVLSMLPLACVPSLRLCCPLAGQGGSAQEALGGLIPTSHPEPILVLSPGPSCALWSYSVLAHPPPSSRKLKGHSGRPRPSPEPSESSVFPGPPTCQGLWALSHPWARGAQPLLMDPALPHGSAGAPEPHPSSPGSVTLKPWSPGLSSSSSSDSVWPLGKPDSLLARGCGLDLFNRSLAIRVSGWSPPGGPEPQDKGPDSLSFLGDSWSGAVVRRVLSGPGSARVEPREPRGEAAGLEGAGLEGEAQQRTLPRKQTSTLPLMDFKGNPGLGRAGTEDSGGVLEGQN